MNMDGRQRGGEEEVRNYRRNVAIFQRRIVETRASFNFRASKQRGFAINVKSPRPGGYKFRGANKFRARLQGIKVLNGEGGIKWMKRNEPHDFSAWTEFSILAHPSPLFVHSTNSCILFFHYVSIYLLFSFFSFFFLFVCLFVYDSSIRPAPPLLCNKRKRRKEKKKDEKKINTSSLSSLTIVIARNNYNNMTRFRYMKEKKKERKKKMEKEEEKKREKIKWHTRCCCCCFLSPLFFFSCFLSHTRNWTRRSPGSRFFFFFFN